jgi:dTDP-4-dehydrorhamnose 3,5-epimerase
MRFVEGDIEGVKIYHLEKYVDERGFLIETYRKDTLPEDLQPVMAYVSMTEPGVARGPHEHTDQTDVFSFIGHANFKIYLWDNRKSSATYGNRMVLFAGEDRNLTLVVPPGVVHAYLNTSKTSRGWVFNYPDRLYAGWGKREAVDEVRHEDEKNEFYQDMIGG